MIFLMIFLIVFSQKLPRKKTLLITFLNLNLQKISDRSLFFISSLVEGLHILGLLLSEIFRISEILLIIRFTTTKLKNLEQPKPSNINIVRQANHKQNQKLLGFNVYNIRINVLRPISQKKPHSNGLSKSNHWFLHESNTLFFQVTRFPRQVQCFLKYLQFEPEMFLKSFF